MKEYIKPYIEDEDIELEDVIAASKGEAYDYSDDSNDFDASGVFPGLSS